LRLAERKKGDRSPSVYEMIDAITILPVTAFELD